jgi:predicted neuraminidase
MMVSTISLLIYGLLGSSISAPEALLELPKVAHVGKNGIVQAGLIFELEGRQTPECHASTIAESPAGLVAAWFGGTHEKNLDVGIWVSRLENGQWTEPVEVVNGVQSINLRYPCWNPVLFQPKTHSTGSRLVNPLILFYKVGPNPREWWGMLTTSEDGGKTWSWPRKLGEHFAVGHLLGPVKNKPIQLSDGAVLCPSSSEVEVENAGSSWKVHFEITYDLGRTWQVIGPIHDGLEFDAIQPSILDYPDGSLQILCRTRQNVLAQSWSKDGGRSWSKMKPTHLPNPNSGIDAVTLRDGRQLLVYNHSVRTGSNEDDTYRNGRQILNVALSKNGRDWKTVLTLENEDNRAGYSYPAVIQASDGMIHITYTWRRQSIKHVTIDPIKMP